MKYWGLGILGLCLLLAAGQTTQAQTQVEVLETYPAGSNVQLAHQQNFYLHLHYQTDVPTHIWARPYFQGQQANAGSHPSRIYAAGEGEALGWFFLASPESQVDEVRISVGDGSPRGTHLLSVYPVTVTASATNAPVATPPEWVARLQAIDKAAHDAAMQKAMNTPPTSEDLLFFNVFMLFMWALMLVGIGWPYWGLWRWRGSWRWLAAMPALVMSFVLLNIIIGVLIDPTSHNLWPFEVLLWGGLSVCWMLVLALLRKLTAAAA